MVVLNLKLSRFEEKTLNYVIVDGSGDIVDLTGLTGEFIVYSGVTEYINKSVNIDDATNGRCSIDLTSVDTNIYVGIYNYKLQFEIGGVDTIFYTGSFEITGDDKPRIVEIRKIYGLEFEDNVIQQALDYAHTEILKFGYEKTEEIKSQQTNEIKINNYVMDMGFDGVVDKDDIEIIQYQKESPYGIINLSANISDIVFDHPNGYTIITMDNNYPEPSYTLRITYYKGSNTFNLLKKNIERLEELYMLLYLFENLDPYKLQRGLKSRSINGVTIEYDQEGIKTMLASLNNMIQREIMKIKAFNISEVKINKKYWE